MPEVIGGGGVKLHVSDAGNRAGVPLVFIHGYCQSMRAWSRQLEGELGKRFRIVAVDLRGHGASGKPQDPEAYKRGQLWADDLAAVLQQLDLKRAVLVPWSYGGRVVGDYLRAYGTKRLGAIAFTAAVTKTGKQFGAEPFNSLFPDALSEDPNIFAPAMQKFVDFCFAPGFALDDAWRRALFEEEMRVPQVAREAISKRGKLDYDDVLRELELPVLCIHGTHDQVILPVSSEHIASTIPNARLSVYPGVGHSPFFEAPERFNRELSELASRVM